MELQHTNHTVNKNFNIKLLGGWQKKGIGISSGKIIGIDSSITLFDSDTKYQNLIFLKEGTIKSNYENNQFNADLVSNFVFSDNLKLNDDYENNNFKIKAYYRNKANPIIYFKGL